jgi:diguanylate cyclase (GGDEF)-like protein
MTDHLVVTKQESDIALCHSSHTEQSDESSQLLRDQLRSIESRDWQLWYIGAVISIVLTAGVVSCLLPELLPRIGLGRLDRHFLPQLMTGLAVMVALLNIYLVQQRRALRATREMLMQQMMRTEVAKQQSWIDPLTGAYNRRYMEETLSREISRANRSGSPFSIVLIDLDGFKQVNTNLGHQAGDQLLSEVVALLNSTLRSSDVVSRYGGDEFVLILPDTDAVEVREVLARVECAKREFNRSNSRRYRMAFSSGASTWDATMSPEEMIRSADADMYLQKNNSGSRQDSDGSLGSLPRHVSLDAVGIMAMASLETNSESIKKVS